MSKESHRRKLKLTEEFMRRSTVSTVKLAAICAAILLSPIAYAQQPKAPSLAYLAQTKDACQQYQDRPTWTLFLVAVPYNGPWTITAVAAFNTKDDKDNKNKDTKDKDIACNDCFDVLTQLNNGYPDPNYPRPNPNYPIPGLHRETADAHKAEGTAQYLACLPAMAPTQRGGGASDDMK
jgi:hypothetical protein